MVILTCNIPTFSNPSSTINFYRTDYNTQSDLVIDLADLSTTDSDYYISDLAASSTGVHDITKRRSWFTSGCLVANLYELNAGPEVTVPQGSGTFTDVVLNN